MRSSDTQAAMRMDRFSFHGYVVDRLRWELRWQGRPVKFCRKSFDLLLYLIDHRDRVVSKAELLDELWPGQVVEESNLSQHVFLIRKALALHDSRANIIETVIGRGYRFSAELEPVQSNSVPIRLPSYGLRQYHALGATST